MLLKCRAGFQQNGPCILVKEVIINISDKRLMLKPAHIAEQELIAQCKTGNLKYQEMLYTQFYGFAMGVGLRYSLNRDDALEAVNDAFIKVFKSIKDYDPAKPFKAWMSTVVINTAIDRRRKELKHQLNTDLDSAMTVQHAVSTMDNLDAQDILNLLNQLPAIHATIFNLYEIDGYNHDEISQMLGIATSSSRVYLTRAKEKLRKLLLITTYNERRSVR
jgi:RNA polymerase sigma factor (sigma-70 family)